MSVFGALMISALLLTAASQDAAFWNNQAQATLRDALRLHANEGVAKNVVFFLGDGMDVTTTTAARIYKGQQEGNPGEETILSWDQFPYVALSKTYNTDQQVPDSAGTATAFFCGVKAKAGTLGLDDRAERSSCSSTVGASVDSLLVQANQAGKATGVISTARVTHATPGALYAHSPERNWETDVDIPAEEAEDGCIDIARQLVEENNFINVILGGGRRNFLPNTTLDPEYGHLNQTGRREDNRDLIERWLADKGVSARYVWNLTAFNEVDISTPYLLGLFEPSHMQYETQRLNDTAGEPSIAEMTEKAITMLQQDSDGFFLMVESGRIDHAHHEGVAKGAMVDTVAFHEAVAKALELTSQEDTLVIVTADHGHVMTIGGYPSRGNPILGYDDNNNGSDSLPYLTLSYANGPGGIILAESYNKTGLRPNHLESDYEADGFKQDATIPADYETHGGTDVAIYAKGPWAHLFHGVHEQNYIPHVVRYAACYDNSLDNVCNSPIATPDPCVGNDSSRVQKSALAVLCHVAALLLLLATV
ncbi:alkaline phosphatase-like [Diadema setosum]|uniref:alkaline phosphatase-like n=1 Tax=Diadema setosum TaxID=31175 RepID=UPI003B3BA159